MERRPLIHSREAWVKSSSPPKVREVWKAPSLWADPDQFALHGDNVVDNSLDIIQAFLKRKPKEEDQKMMFLNSICTGCSITHMNTSVKGVLRFMQPELVDAIKELLEDEPTRHLDNMVWQQAILTITSMSRAGLLLQDRKSGLLHLCFSRLFHLPPPKSSQEFFYTKTLAAMDSMLQVMVVSAEQFGLLELQNIFQLLLPFTVFQPMHTQERAMARIARLTRFISTHPLQVCPCFAQAIDLQHICSKNHKFAMLGRLLGHLTLSCASKHKGICLEATEALHHLYAFILLHIGRLHDIQQFLLQEHKLKREPKHSVIACPEPVLMLMKNLHPSQQADILVMTIKSMRSPNTYCLKTAARIIDVLMADPVFQLGQVLNIVQAIYRSLYSTSEVTALNSLKRVLLALMYKYPTRTVTSLLECSPICNNVAMFMWTVVVSNPRVAEKVLLALIRMLMNQSLHKTSASAKKNPRVLSLAAAKTINKILQEPTCVCEAKAIFPQLFMALLFQVSFTTELMLWEVKIFWSKHQNDRVSPIRCAVESMMVLLQIMDLESQLQAIQAQGGWDALLSTQTHLTGVCIIAREMMKASRPVVSSIFCHLTELLRVEDSTWETVAMAFLVEMLGSTKLNEELNRALEVFPIYLQSHCLGVPRLVLEGILKLLERPSIARRTFFLLPHIMGQLQDAESDAIAVALLVLNRMLQLQKEKVRSLTALVLAEKLRLLFNNESVTVRKRSIRLFQNTMEFVTGTIKKRMETEVWNSLLPLLFHFHDKNKKVSKASQQALCRAGQFLKWGKLAELAKTSNAWRINECLLTKRSKAKEFLHQSQQYLQSPQKQLRLEAVRFIGLLGRQANEEEVAHIVRVLQYANKDDNIQVRSLAIQTLYILNGRRKPKLRFNLQRLSFLLPRRWTRPHPSTSSNSAHADTA